MFPIERFKGKRILVGITGGIAAYKTAELVRYLKTQGAEVKVVMTAAAEKFITRLTMETLSQNPVGVEMFPEKEFTATHHIHLADWAEAAIIVPASYNFIGKIYAGIADDLLTTTMAAVHCPVVIAPAMNVHMWQNPVNQRNLDYLRSLEYLICTPGEGFLAEGYSGKGRLADLEHLIQYLYRAIHPEATSLKGKKVLVTAGGTEEPLDPVRIFTNRSSGKMGYALAWEAFARGAEVTLIHGLSDVPDPVDLSIIGVKTAAEMFKAVQEQLPSADIYLSAAAIADFTPREVQKGKIKKQEGDLNITFKKTSDVLQYAGEHKLAHQQLIGFAVETDDPENQARKKMNQKNLDMIVLNNPLEKGAEFGSDTNKVILFHKNGNSEQVTTMPKVDIAFRIFDFLLRNR